MARRTRHGIKDARATCRRRLDSIDMSKSAMVESTNGRSSNRACEPGRDSESLSRSNLRVRQAPLERTRIRYRSAHLRDERSTPSQSETTRAMNAVVRRAEVVMRPPRTTTVMSDRRKHLWLDLDKTNSIELKTNRTMIRNTTQQSTKGLDECASSLSNADMRETMQRMRCNTQQSTKAEQQPATRRKGKSLKTSALH